MKARIEELVDITLCVETSLPDAIRRALTTLAEECYERAAKECDAREGAAMRTLRHCPRDTFEISAATTANTLSLMIRKLKEEL